MKHGAEQQFYNFPPSTATIIIIIMIFIIIIIIIVIIAADEWGYKPIISLLYYRTPVLKV